MTRRLVFLLVTSLFALLNSSDGLAADPAPDILPARTIAYVRIRHTVELARQLQKGSVGMALTDPEVQPLVELLWGSFLPTLQQWEGEAGLTLDDLLAAAPGEMVFAMVDVPDMPPGYTLMFRPEGNDKTLDALEFGADKLRDAGFRDTTETVDGMQLKILQTNEGPIQEIVQMDLGDWRVVATDRELAAVILALHQQQPIDRLTEHPPFRSVISRCRSERRPAEIEWYVDPIGIAKALTRGNFAASAGLAFLPALGVDGLQGIGGLVTIADEEYDLLARTHVLIEPPRDGILKAIALGQGSAEPEPWVPANASTYITWHLDPQVAYNAARELVDSFRGEGGLKRILDRRISDNLGIDFESEILEQLAGRISQVVSFEQGGSVEDQSTAVGIELNDPEVFRRSMDRVLEKFPDRIQRETFAGTEIFRVVVPDEPQAAANADDEAESDEDENPRERRRRRERRRMRERWRSQPPAAAILGSHIVIAQQMGQLEQIIMTFNDAQPRLRDELDYKLVVSKLKRHSSTSPAMIRFERPEKGLEALYQTLQSDTVRAQIRERRETNEFFAALDEILTNDQLPPFAVLAQYFAPAGSILVNEESGFHHVTFGLRREVQSRTVPSP